MLTRTRSMSRPTRPFFAVQPPTPRMDTSLAATQGLRFAITTQSATTLSTATSLTASTPQPQTSAQGATAAATTADGSPTSFIDISSPPSVLFAGTSSPAHVPMFSQRTLRTGGAPVAPAAGNQSTTATNIPLLFSDASYAPKTFDGTNKQDAERWLRRFRHYIEFRQMDDSTAIQLFRLLLTEIAADWLEALPAADRQSLTTLCTAFSNRFIHSDILKWKQMSEAFTRQQGPSECVDTFIADIQNLARRVPVTDEHMIRYALIKGLKPSIRHHVLQAQVTTLEDTIRAARVAEAAASAGPADNTDVQSLSQDVRALAQAFKDFQEKSRAKSPTPERCAAFNTNSSSRSTSPRRVTFADGDDHPTRRPPTQQPTTFPAPAQNYTQNWSWPANYEPAWQHPPPQSYYNRPQMRQTRFNQGPPRNDNRYGNNRPTSFRQQPQQTGQYSLSDPCRNCGTAHNPNACPARGLQCYNCGRVNHLRRCCRSTPAINRPQ